MTGVKYVTLHGERLAYREAGGGDEVLVLLHGMAGSSDTWQAVMSRLPGSLRVIAPDLLGHGQSDKPRADYSLGAFAAGLRDLFGELGVDRATLVGHSLGGGVAMQFAYQHPEYCRRLVLVSSGGLGPDVGWILRLLAAPGAELVLPVLAPKLVLAAGNRLRPWLSAVGAGSPWADQVWQAYGSLSDAPTRAAFLRTLRSVVDYRGQSVSALSRLRLRAEVPTQVIWGDRDPIIPVAHGYEVQAARPNSRLVVLPGLGHFPQVEAPGAVAAVIEDFIATSGRPAIDGLMHDLHTRSGIDRAIGVLMALRGCSQADASREFVDAVQETGLPAEELGGALAELAGGVDPRSSRHGSVARGRWGHLLALRGLDGEHSGGRVEDSVHIRYGPHNETTIC